MEQVVNSGVVKLCHSQDCKPANGSRRPNKRRGDIELLVHAKHWWPVVAVAATFVVSLLKDRSR